MAARSYWQQAWDEAEPRLAQWRNDAWSPQALRTLRVGQLDAELLDEELVQLLSQPLMKALAVFNAAFKAKVEPELLLVMRLTLYKFSLWDLGATYGAKLQDLRYAVSNMKGKATAPSGLPKSTLAIHALLTVILPYTHTRLRNHALSKAWPDTPSSDRRRRAWNVLNRMEAIHGVAALISFVAFLWSGRYRTLADRIVSMRLVSAKNLTNRQVSYEFMNRQMVWHSFTEFLLLVLPFFRSRLFRRSYKQVLQTLTSSQSLLPGWPWSPSSSAQQTSANRRQKGPYANLSADQCAICAQNASFSIDAIAKDPLAFSLTASTFTDSSGSGAEAESGDAGTALPPAHPIVNAYRASCGHDYCYYCLCERLMCSIDDGDDGWACLRCEETIRSCSRAEPELPASNAARDGDDDAFADEDISSFTSEMSYDDVSEY